ncbi:tannase and feruloyl esterase-domain-containing protein [Podospora fimiseda]|uniref:Carboxylic ester hydrolase n=1 Tax=Podospora fimiseda TaxID=252190 RepID=A0AAN7GXN8_9PEZI|nr:tannase and feruloyl esterase-domain-containing protein [Podospora fimiseda]
MDLSRMLVCPSINIMKPLTSLFGLATQQALVASLPCAIDTFEPVLPAYARIVSAEFVPSGRAYSEGRANIAYPTAPTQLPELCAVIVNVSTSDISNYRFGLFLPTEWNSRFLAVGNGGFAGGINWLDMGAGVRYGHAVVSTDTGHNSTVTDISWALNNDERKKDFGYRAMHGSVQLGKVITQAYYAKNISYSYYSGASTGGRQGLKEAMVSPDSFDGLLIGAPAWYTSHLQTWTTKVASYNLPVSDKKRVSPALFNALPNEVVRQCDEIDGVKDGIVSHPDRCNFTLTPLLCSTEGVNPSACLTAEQADTIRNVYADFYAEEKFAFPGLELSSEHQWSFLLGGNSPNPLGDGYMQYFLFDDPSWNWTKWNDSIVWQADSADPGNCTADDYDLTALKERGGKILMYHGASDALIPQRSSDVFYERVAEAMGGMESLQSWFRYFIVPGMQHVTGTAVNAPWYFAGSGAQGSLGTATHSTPGFEDARHDSLLALMAWVETGTAVDEIVATTWTRTTDPRSGVLRQRPICPFPKRQTYKGGDPNMTSEEQPPSALNIKENIALNSEGALTEKKNHGIDPNESSEHGSLKYSLLGPSLTKAGQDEVDQAKVSEIIYNASKGSKFFNREEERDKALTARIDKILEKKRRLETLDLSRELRAADRLIAELESTRDLTQHIVHMDCDAFYAAVELLDRPELEHLPFAVGGGVLTTCNYVARQFGCRSGMAGFVAKKLCPELIFLPLNFDKYNAKAAEVREILADYDPRFESASIDEAYLNITQYCVDHAMSPEDVVSQMRKEIHEKTKITVSAGIAANARLAKICSNMNKPNGQYLLPADKKKIMEFMRDLPCRKVNGVGRVLERELSSVGIKTCGDIYAHRQYIDKLFGDKTYEFLLRCYLGLGRTNIQPAEEYERKSVGTERTFPDMDDPIKLREQLRKTAEDLEKDMKRAECKARTLCIKVKLHTYEVLTRQVATPKSVFLAEDLYQYALPMLVKLEQENPKGLKLRLMGLRCTHLVSTKKPDTLAFFGLKGGKTSDGKPKMKPYEEEWEQWPEEEEQGEANNESGESGEGESPFRRHGKEILPNPKKKETSSPAPRQEEEWWDCPICNRPQPIDERQFNEHIDLCLSRQAIRDTVQEVAAATATPVSNKVTTMPVESNNTIKKGKEKKRGRPAAAAAAAASVDPKQKKLKFG